jgi:hypothetical protein
MEAQATFARQMAELAEVVERAALLARQGLARHDDEVLSHGDIDQKNLVLTRTGPVLCVWDYAAPWVPTRELVDVALSLGRRDYEIARRVIASYEAASGQEVHLDSTDLAPSLMIGLDWTVLNVERAIGLCEATSAERELAVRLVPELLAEFQGAVELAEAIPSVLSLR